MPSRATVSDSTETQVIAVNVRDHLVDDVGSTRSLITDILRILARCVTEVVDCERLIAIIDEFDNFTYILEWELVPIFEHLVTVHCPNCSTSVGGMRSGSIPALSGSRWFSGGSERKMWRRGQSTL